MRKTFNSAPRKTDIPGIDFDAVGRITAGDLLALEPGADAHYMLCCPTRFLADLRGGLEAGDIPSSHIHYETFGPFG